MKCKSDSFITFCTHFAQDMFQSSLTFIVNQIVLFNEYSFGGVSIYRN